MLAALGLTRLGTMWAGHAEEQASAPRWMRAGSRVAQRLQQLADEQRAQLEAKREALKAQAASSGGSPRRCERAMLGQWSIEAPQRYGDHLPGDKQVVATSAPRLASPASWWPATPLIAKTLSRREV